ncbi:hypothetical protein, partial [Mesorhizobium japonicum]|uniref:hypothetical protein n=1 Tax=Mesorhizobium japonicum TaxID=2066070 RepID=UPI003B5BA931
IGSVHQFAFYPKHALAQQLEAALNMSSREYLYKNLRPELVVPEAPAQGDSNASLRSSEPRFTLERDVVLSASNRQQLDEALVKIRYHDVIY